MSLIKVDSISNVAGSNTGTVDNMIQSQCTAWVNFTGAGTVAIRDSFNVSSITDNGTGDYTINLTNSLADTNYSTSVSYGLQVTGYGFCHEIQYQSRTTSAFRMFAGSNTNAASDADNIFAQVFGGN